MQDLLFTSGNIIDEKYEIISCLGKGGMGTVYKAKQDGLSRTVALKILQAGLADDGESWSRFEREAVALAQLSHRNIATFYSYGVWQERVPYIAMEYLDGLSLADTIVKEEKLDWGRSLKLIMQVCDAMSFAHNNGIVHRDLKPSNIILLKHSSEELVKVMDFGLAKLLHPDGREAQKLTQTGMLVGSVQYLSPEQSKGLKADHRSDIYAVGCVLYECLTGAPPFSADNPIGIIHKHANEEPQPASSRLQESLPSGLDDVLLKTLAKEPNDRHQSMLDLRNDLNEILHGRAGLSISSAQRTGKASELSESIRKRNQTVALLAVAAVACSMVLIGVYALKSSRPKDQQKPIDTLAQKNNFIAAQNEAAAGNMAFAEANNEEAMKHFIACIDLVQSSKRPKEILLKLEAMSKLGNCYINIGQPEKARKIYTDVVQLMEEEVDPKSNNRRLDRKSAITWMLHSYGNLINLEIAQNKLNDAETYVKKYGQFCAKYAKVLPSGRQTFLAFQSNLFSKQGKYKEAVAAAREARNVSLKNPSPDGTKFYLDNTFHLIRISADAKLHPAEIEKLQQEYLQGLKLYKPQFLNEVGFQLSVMAEELGKSDRKKALAFWSAARQILLDRKLWILAHEFNYDNFLFALFLEREIMPDVDKAISARKVFLDRFKSENVAPAILVEQGSPAMRGVCRWTGRTDGPEASLAFLSEVKSVYKKKNLESRVFYLTLIEEMLLAASRANRPDSFAEKKELENILSSEKDLTPMQRGTALCTLAYWDFSKNRYDLAKQKFAESAIALKSGKSVSSSDAESFAYLQIGRINDIQKNYAEAEHYYQRTIDSIKARRKNNKAAQSHWIATCISMANALAPGIHKDFLAKLQAELKSNEAD